MAWDYSDAMVGERVLIQTTRGEDELATVLAVSTVNASLRVRADDGAILVGNQWESAE